MIQSARKTVDACQFDVVILGGGLAGLTHALQCQQNVPDVRIAILEKNAHPVPEAAFKVGESTVEVATYYFTKVLGLEEHVLKDQLPKNGLRFFFGADGNRSIERRLEMGGTVFPPTPSYQFDRGRFENYLAKLCQERGVEFLDAARVTQVELARGRGPHQVRYHRSGRDENLTARWVVDASGRAAILKRQLDLAEAGTHLANAAWFRVSGKVDVDDWCDDPDWTAAFVPPSARWFSTNHLMGEGYWVWLIPLASNSTSIGIVADDAIHPLSEFNSTEKALAWLDRYEPQCAEKVRERQNDIQDFLSIKHYSRKCKQVFSSRRWGIIGDAGYFLDPFYSPGSDFIALGNTFLCRLIQRDLTGRSNWFHARVFDRLYRLFYHGTLACFQDQYRLFGNHQVMPVKILWDWMVYWTMTGNNFMHDRTCDVRMYARHFLKIKRVDELNRFLQKFFRQWHAEAGSFETTGFLDTSNVPVIVETNLALQDNLDDRQFAERFACNVRQVETLFWEIIDHSGMDIDVPFKRHDHQGAIKHGFECVFDVTQQRTEPEESGQVEQEFPAEITGS